MSESFFSEGSACVAREEKRDYPLLDSCTGYVGGPLSLCLDQEGNLLVVEESAHCITKYDPQLKRLDCFGRKGTGPGEFVYPTDITVDGDNNYYVTDRWNHRVQKFDARGTYLREFGGYGRERGALNEPWGICENAHGDIVVADCGNARIVFFDPEGRVLREYGRCGPSAEYYEGEEFKRNAHYRQWLGDISRSSTVESQFYDLKFEVGNLEYPERICSAPDGCTYVSDPSSGRLVVFSAQGLVCRTLSRRKQQNFPAVPGTVCVVNDACYVAEEETGQLWKWEEKTVRVCDFGHMGIKISDFYLHPHEMRLYVCDAWNGGVYVFQLR